MATTRLDHATNTIKFMKAEHVLNAIYVKNPVRYLLRVEKRNRLLECFSILVGEQTLAPRGIAVMWDKAISECSRTDADKADFERHLPNVLNIIPHLKDQVLEARRDLKSEQRLVEARADRIQT